MIESSSSALRYVQVLKNAKIPTLPDFNVFSHSDSIAYLTTLNLSDNSEKIPTSFFRLEFSIFQPEQPEIQLLYFLGHPIDQLLVYFLVIIQFLSIFGFTGIIAIFTRKVHSCRRNLDRLQKILGKDLLSHKWKFMQLYEVINSDQKIGFSMGPMGTVSPRAFLEVRENMVFGF